MIHGDEEVLSSRMLVQKEKKRFNVNNVLVLSRLLVTRDCT